MSLYESVANFVAAANEEPVSQDIHRLLWPGTHHAGAGLVRWALRSGKAAGLPDQEQVLVQLGGFGGRVQGPDAPGRLRGHRGAAHCGRDTAPGCCAALPQVEGKL
jgi:hypothetical protein